jgi:hypothetical protein
MGRFWGLYPKKEMSFKKGKIGVFRRGKGRGYPKDGEKEKNGFKSKSGGGILVLLAFQPWK